MIGLEPVPLEGDTEEKREIPQVGHPPWEVSGSSHRLDAPVLGSYQGRWVRLAHWRTAGITAAWRWIWGSHNGQDLTVGRRGDLVPGRSLGGVVAATVGANSSSASEAAQISDGRRSTTAHPLTIHTAGPLWAPGCLQYGSTTGWQRLGAVIGCEGQRGLAPEAASEWSEGNNSGRLHGHSIRDSSDLCLRLTWAENLHGLHLLHHCSSLGQGTRCRERGKHTLKRNRDSLGLNLRASAPATWDQTLSLIGKWWPLSRGEVLPHTLLQL